MGWGVGMLVRGLWRSFMGVGELTFYFWREVDMI